MNHAELLPPYLVTRYESWKASDFERNKSWYRHLAEDGQHPRAMAISCCDSRVCPSSLFATDPGELFLHRNIASVVPRNEPGLMAFGTPAAVEYAIRALHVAHLIVIGHSGCGGVKGAHDKFSGKAEELNAPGSMIGGWVEHLLPAYERTRAEKDKDKRLLEMEKAGVLLSLENLMTYDFVAQAVEADQLTLHALWIDIGSGTLEQYDPAAEAFVPA